MTLNSILRIISVLIVMLVVGFGWYGVSIARLKRQGADVSQAGPQAAQRARTASLVAAFLYMVGMVSVAGLFL